MKGRQAPEDGARSKIKVGIVVFAAIAGFLLLAEHRAHVVPYLPWLLLAVCPLMHLFMHHGGHRHGEDRPAGTSDANTSGDRK